MKPVEPAETTVKKGNQGKPTKTEASQITPTATNGNQLNPRNGKHKTNVNQFKQM